MPVRCLARTCLPGFVALALVVALIVVAPRPASAAGPPLIAPVDGPAVTFAIGAGETQIVRFPSTPGLRYVVRWSTTGFDHTTWVGRIDGPQGFIWYYPPYDPEQHAEVTANGATTDITFTADGDSPTGSVTIGIEASAPDVIRTITPNGASTRVTFTKPLQLAHLLFDAPAGRRYVLRWTPHGFAPPGWFGLGFISARDSGAASFLGYDDVAHWKEWPTDPDGSTDIRIDPDDLDVGSIDVSVQLVPPDITVAQTTASWREVVHLAPGQRATYTWPTVPGRHYLLTWVPHDFRYWGWINTTSSLLGEWFGYNEQIHQRDMVAYATTTEIAIGAGGASTGTLTIRVTEVP